MKQTNQKNTKVAAVDVETALHTLFQPQDTCGSSERLSGQASVVFRAGHAGDAATIESVIAAVPTEANEKSEKLEERKNRESSSSRELWLSEALGDEDRPPSLFSILADVSFSETNESDSSVTNKRQLGAIALFTVAWRDKQRELRLEWFYIDKSVSEAQVLSRKMWLRLSMLALMTGSCLNVSNARERIC